MNYKTDQSRKLTWLHSPVYVSVCVCVYVCVRVWMWMCEAALIQGARTKRKQPKCFKEKKKPEWDENDHRRIKKKGY